MAKENDNQKNTMKLDDASRVKVLSPGMLVAKRFFRNKLAIVGMVIIISMFLFSFLGGVLIPYTQSQVFYTTEQMRKDYAGATYITDYLMIEAENVEVPSDAYSKAILGIAKKKPIVESRKGGTIGIRKLSDNSYILYSAKEIKNPLVMKSQEHKNAVAAGNSYFEIDGKSYMVDTTAKKEMLYEVSDMAVLCMYSFTAFDENVKFPYKFYENVLLAMSVNAPTFDLEGDTYSISNNTNNAFMIHSADGSNYAYVSNMNINNIVKGIYLTPEFKEVTTKAITEAAESFTFTKDTGEVEEYILSEKDGQFLVQRYQETRVIATYQAPSKEHWVGTDGNGMDLLARLMFGGRISLLIGFVVVSVEIMIGVLLGGIAGFFGGWVDNLIMRLVDVIYCLPGIPLYLILGSIMDYYRASSTVRIYALMIVMSLLGWVGVCRIVRGQILSLREQEFMIATEATGISIKRRILKHLIPNVVPQLIVVASMGIGDVILSEATLSFLGLGIKYPAASWGSIINAVNDSYVMTNYLFVWIPAGFLILLTVLAFNFVGDGLRDAFDPKMKR